MKKKGIAVNMLIYLYMALPTLIFMVGWLKWYWALLFGALAAYACARGFTVSIQDKSLLLNKINGRIFIKALLLIILWVYLSGIGGWCYQTMNIEMLFFVRWWNTTGLSCHMMEAGDEFIT